MINSKLYVQPNHLSFNNLYERAQSSAATEIRGQVRNN